MSTELTNYAAAVEANLKNRHIVATGTLDADGSVTFFWPGGGGTFVGQGTFGSGTLDLQWSEDGSNYVAVGTDTTLTADGKAYFIHEAGNMRVNLSGSTSPDLIYKVSRVNK